MNNDFTIVDEIRKEDLGMAATLFVKSGDELIRVATSVWLPDGRRAVGTVLAPPALDLYKSRQTLLWRSPGSWHGICY